jgi:predicted metal-dependent phosphoesterase TrpH
MQSKSQCITPAQAAILMAQGWKRADLHVHTSKSHDVLPITALSPKALYDQARRDGFHYVTFTDHDTMTAYKELGDQPGLVRGAEITIFDPRVGHTLHINVFTLNDDQFFELERISIEEQDVIAFVNYCKKQKLPYVLNHPYWLRKTEERDEAAIELITPLFPVVELNAAMIKQKNDLALQLAQRHKKPVIAASDTHIGGIGGAYTIAQGDTFAEFWANIVAGKAYVVRSDMTTETLLAEVKSRVGPMFSTEISESDLRHFAKRQPGFHLPTALLSALLLARRNIAMRFLLKQSLNTVAYSRIPAAVYLTKEGVGARKLKQKVKAIIR